MTTSNRFTKKVQAALDGMHLDEHPDRDALRHLVQGLDREQGNRILRAALKSYFESEALKPYQAELIKMQSHLEQSGHKVIILFDGRDASGKGGTIRRVSRYMNEKHYRIVALGKPTEQQQGELHMKRYIEQFPHPGEIVLFDRSWYNRAMVEPVMGFCTNKQYKQFMSEVNSYERNFVADEKTTLIKLYFSVSKSEQAKRFARRANDPLRAWKLSEVDLQAQSLWKEFTVAKAELLRQTSTELNPWWVIRSDDKHLARLETMKLILSIIDFPDRSPDLNFKRNESIVVPGKEEYERMSKARKRDG